MKIDKSRLLIIALTLCFSAAITSAQKIPDKPFEKWSKDEAMKVLTASSWVQTYQSTEGLAAASQDQISREQADQRVYRSSNPGASAKRSIPPPVVMRLHSALPIRQALVRMRQIDAGYDKMDEKQRAEFDQKSTGLLTCAICKKFYVVTMTKFVDTTGQSVDEGVFQGMSFEQLKGNVWLVNEAGERRELAQFNAPKNATDMAVFYFARNDDNGNALITSKSKNFKFMFAGEFLNGGNNRFAPLLPRHFDFNVSKLIAADNVMF